MINAKFTANASLCSNNLDTCGEAWLALLGLVNEHGVWRADDKGLVRACGPTSVAIRTLSEQDPILMRHGDMHRLALYGRKFEESEIVPPFQYSYGQRISDRDGTDQLGSVMKRLSTYPESKSAVVDILRTEDLDGSVPCLTQIMFLVSDGALDMTGIFRSQNVFHAYLNYLPLSGIQRGLAERLGRPPGAFRVFINSPHYYHSDEREIVSILKEQEVPL